MQFAVFAANIHANETTQYSAFQLVYGRLPNLPIDAALNFQKSIYSDVDDYAATVKDHFTKSLTVVQSKIEKGQQRYKSTYDKQANDKSYEIGDYVLKDTKTYKKGLTPKFLPLYDGPYRIIKINHPNIVIENIKKPSLTETIHINRTKQYYPRDAPKSIQPTELEERSKMISATGIKQDETKQMLQRYNLRSGNQC